MRIKRLRLVNFRAHRDSTFELGNFRCLIGTNGIGKTTALDAVSLLCSSLDFKEIEFEAGPEGFAMKATAEQRLQAFLRPNIDNRFGATDFVVEGLFEHEGQEYKVSLSKDGFKENEILKQRWWWPGISYFARFDENMANFQLDKESWPKFARAYEAITGWPVDPEIMVETDLEDRDEPAEIVAGFYLKKRDGRIYSRQASAGEKKIAKALSQVLNLPEERKPHIVLVDNLEAHVHHSRHLRMFQAIKEFFDAQIVATTHSTVIIDRYEPRSDIIDLDAR